MAVHLLIVDDEPSILQSLSSGLRDEGYHVTVASSGAEAIAGIERDPPIMVLLDIWMEGLDGIETLKKMKELSPDLLVIMMSGHGTIETAVKATKLGAYDYVEKPFSLERILLLIKHALHEQRLQEENVQLKEAVRKRVAMVGKSPVMNRLIEQIQTAARTHSWVLITGENGTGKELAARAIHLFSPRADKPFVEVNCAAIPESLIENELFGHERGAFTGAAFTKKGKFELADGGTLFLDEVGDMSVTTQAKLLKVLEQQRPKFHRVGGTRLIEVDVRIVSASNKNLPEEIKKGAFRDDLYYRLNVIPIHVPPLREKKEDIPLLVDHFLEQITVEQGIKRKEITKEAVSLLMQYGWPGNIRELKNLIERVVIMAPSPLISPSDLPTFFLEKAPAPIPAEGTSFLFSSLREARSYFEKEFITRKLRENGWNVSKTAEELKIERSHLHRKIKFLGIEILDEGR